MTEIDVVEAARVTEETMDDSYHRYERDHYPAIAHDFDKKNHNSDEYMKGLEGKARYSFVVEVDNKIAGVATGRIFGQSGLAQLGWICIHPDYQKNDLGKKLLNFVIDFCKDQGCHKISLNTMVNLIPAINLYRNIGFFEEARFEKHWWKADFVQMSLWLDR